MSNKKQLKITILLIFFVGIYILSYAKRDDMSIKFYNMCKVSNYDEIEKFYFDNKYKININYKYKINLEGKVDLFETPFINSTKNLTEDRIKIMQFLVDNGANLNQKIVLKFNNTDNEYSTFYLSANNNNNYDEIVDFFIKNNINTKQTYWRTDFNISFLASNIRIMNLNTLKKFLKYDEKLNIKNESLDGKNLLFYVLDQEVFDYLVEEGLNPKKLDNSGNNIFIIYILNLNDAKILKTLEKYNFDINFKNKYGITPLIASVLSNNKSCFNYIKEKGDLNIRDNDGKTALIYAVLCNNKYFVESLLAEGAVKNIKDFKGKTAYDYSKDLGLDEIQKILKKI
ncbi:ankyrin repeat domain-containing protein [Oceanotoga sp. DSM 15011]|uniref:Ankyrin repeat protein n=1 Tax=Oceanotoga teriensis TaxID=515440 RepID=A0AA45C547_9BACT|nr:MULTISPECIES: ankyrin repeat domain-containing protein [Oceanotoga]PWJ87902.1 ankyrin repeat protein [Oceanotoga teriensis]UYO99262.1 ankyrin repeat domain-containing protein [Oceanotoga sp. DSM 15011]